MKQKKKYKPGNTVWLKAVVTEIIEANHIDGKQEGYWVRVQHCEEWFNHPKNKGQICLAGDLYLRRMKKKAADGN